MMPHRLASLALAAVLTIAQARADQVLPPGQIDGASNLKIGPITLGRRQGNAMRWSGDGSNLSAIIPGTPGAPSVADMVGQTFSVLSYKTPASIDGTSDDIAIQGAVNAALTRNNGRVVLPPRSTCYVLSAPININAGVNAGSSITLEGGGVGACIKPGVPMASMVTVGGRWLQIRNIQFMNEAGRATNGIEMVCPSGIGNTNNKLWIERNSFFFLKNGIKNTNCDAWTVTKNWFQDNTGWDIWSADNGTASMISDNYSIGAPGNVLYESVNYKSEGWTIRGNIFLPTAGQGIKVKACLACVIENNQVDQTNDTALTLDGSASPIADVTVGSNWFGVKANATLTNVGVNVASNVTELRFVNNSSVGWKQCGVRLQADQYSIQNVLISGYRGITNGTGEGTGDFCAVPGPPGGGGVSYTVRDSWLLSSGAGQRSAVEFAGAVGTWRNNRIAAAPTKSAASSWVDNYGDDRDAATGKYAGWAQFPAAPACETGSLGPGIGVDTGYARDRNTVAFRIRLRIPNTTALGTCAGLIYFTLPAASGGGTAGAFPGRNIGANPRPVSAWFTSGTAFAATDLTGSTLAAAGADILLSGTYEAAP